MCGTTLIRRLIGLLAAISLIFFLATIVLWIRSHHVRDIVDFGVQGGNSHTVQSILGRVHVVSHLSGGRVSSKMFYSSDRLSPNAGWNGGMSGYPSDVKWFWGGVFQRYSQYHMPRATGGTGFRTARQLIVVPYGWLSLLFVLLPAANLSQIVRQRRRISRASCATCGYDLRGNPASGSCPECGRPIPASPNQAFNLAGEATGTRPSSESG